MRITGIKVNKLFGRFDHNVELHTADRITIIYGPNGFGKTVLLKLLDGLFNRRYDYLYSTKFECLEVQFDNKSHIELTRIDQVTMMAVNGTTTAMTFIFAGE